MRSVSFLLIAVVLLLLPCRCFSGETALKKASALYSANNTATARINAEKYRWAADIRSNIIRGAEPWLKFSDDELWNLMFGNTISRSWMVWSDGYCPACKKDVRMYSWKIDALGKPWKVQCPRCGEQFPKNDFYAYYRSGIDEHGVFNPGSADRSLLYNTEHPDVSDPLHRFGVDDGEGYVEGDKRWRFIGAYLIYGQWKQAIVGGIRNLAAAYVVTGDRTYAHKAGILLDRVADLYTTFDFGVQGLVYERKGNAGYISTWHDACAEHREIVVAYDQVFDALRTDTELAAFLSRKAREYKLDNTKSSFADIQRNIEDGILRDAIKNSGKIRSNYPWTDIALILTHTVLNWPDNRDEVMTIIDAMVDTATAVDGLSGEKGLVGYSASPINSMAELLETFARMDSTFLPDLMSRHPNLRKTYRFHIDVWFNGEYYPQIGDTGNFAVKSTSFPTARATSNPGIGPSMYSFLQKLYELTGDQAYVQLLYRQNGYSVENLPCDLFCPEPETFQKKVQEVIDRCGSTIEVGSVNKEQWCLAMMRSGKGKNVRAFWLDYDTGERHSHIDGMNLGLFARGLDLMPEFGYPPVQFGGWESPRALWVRKTAAHNTVVVDGKDQDNPRERHIGKTTLWADGASFRAVRASAPEFYGIEQYERTVAMADISDEDFYLVDIFRVVGGADHAKFMHSHFGPVNVFDLSLHAADDYGHDTIMRNFSVDPSPSPSWRIEWRVEDRNGYLPPGADVRVGYIDVTTGAQAYVAEGWISPSSYNDSAETWIPRIMVRRQSEQSPLASTFVGIIEPYEGRSNIASVRRLAVVDGSGTPFPDANVVLEVILTDGRRDVIVAADIENPLNLKPRGGKEPMTVQVEPAVRFDGELCCVRFDRSGNCTHVALSGGSVLDVGDVELSLKSGAGFVEIDIEGNRATVVTGEKSGIGGIKVRGKELRVE